MLIRLVDDLKEGFDPFSVGVLFDKAMSSGSSFVKFMLFT